MGPRDDDHRPGLKKPVGMETFICFKRVCVIERNTNKGSRSDPTPKEVQNISVGCVGCPLIMKFTHKVFQQKDYSSGSENEARVHAMSGTAPKPWNPPPWIEIPLPID